MDSRPEYGIGRIPADDDGFADTKLAIESIEVEQRLRERGRIIDCPNCGSPTYPEQLMSASLGTACPECYDDMSD